MSSRRYNFDGEKPLRKYGFRTGLVDKTPLSYNPEYWFDPSQEVGYSDGTTVYTMKDFSGNGRDAYHASSSLKFAKDQFNNLPAFHHPPGPPRYAPATAVYSSGFSQPNTVFVIGKNYTPNVSSYADTVDAAWAEAVGISNNDSTVYMYAGTSKTSTVKPFNIPYLVCAVFNGASSYMYINGIQQGSAGNAGNNGTKGWHFMTDSNSTTNISGFLGEFIHYHRLLTDEERAIITTYLMYKWGIYS